MKAESRIQNPESRRGRGRCATAPPFRDPSRDATGRRGGADFWILDSGFSLPELHSRLLAAYGPQHWWPAERAFEMIVGAFLVQNTAWSNAEKAIARLKAAEMLSPEAIQRTSEGELAGLIRSSGYFRQKAKKVKAFVAHLFARHGGSLERLLSQDAGALRQELLALHGVGPETADSIVLYAANQPIFVVDAYTRRLFDRLGLLRQPTYDAVQAYCHARLPLDAPLFNELHALIVRHSVVHCRARPICVGCPLLDVCPTGARSADGQRLP